MVNKKTPNYEPTNSEILKAVIDGFEKTEHRFVAIENRMDGFEKRMCGLEARIDGFEDRISGLEDRIGGLEERMERGFYLLRIDINALQHHLPPIDIPKLYEDVQNIKLKIGMK